MNLVESLELLEGSPGCFVCDNTGTNPRSLAVKLYWNPDSEKVVIPFVADSTWCGYENVVHGGILASLQDDAMAWAIRKTLGKWAVTARYSLRYSGPVVSEKNYMVEGWVVRDKGKRIETCASIIDDTGKIMVTAEALFVVMK